jgi:hypothetical protein
MGGEGLPQVLQLLVAELARAYDQGDGGSGEELASAFEMFT